MLCSAAFVSGLDPDQVFAETPAAMPGTGLISWALAYRVDRERKDVTVTLFGGAEAARSTARVSVLCRASTMRSPMPRCRRRQARRAALAAGHCRAVGGRARHAGTRRCARSRLRRARTAAASPHQGGRRGQGRPHRRRALCARLWHRHANPRLLRDQIGDLGPDRHSGSPGQARGRSTGAGRGLAKPGRSPPCHHGRSIAAAYRGPRHGQLAPCLAAERPRAGQPDEIHRARHGRIRRKRRSRDARRAAPGTITTATTSSCRA